MAGTPGSYLAGPVGDVSHDGSVNQHHQPNRSGTPHAAPQQRATAGPGPSVLPEPVDPGASVPGEAEPTHRPSRRRRRRLLAWVLLTALLGGGLAAGALLPVDKVIESPGPTWNVLGTADGTDILTVSGAPVYASSGALRMTTVSVRGCPGYPVTLLDVVVAGFRPDQRVVDRETVCPDTMTADEVDQASQAQMAGSQDSAVVAALMETGEATSQTLTVAGTAEAEVGAVVSTGDVLTSVTPAGDATTTVTTYTQLRDLMATTAPGTSVTLGLTRDGAAVEATVVTQEPEDATRAGSVLGLYLSVTADSTVNATFGLTDVGGPSAGMVFALGIVDEMTPGSLTGGKDVAGTGTIDVTGAVGAIGGIAQKMAGAADAGSDYFLAPTANCADVVGHEPDGMEVYAVSTLHEAVEATTAIADDDTSELATCQAVMDTSSSPTAS